VLRLLLGIGRHSRAAGITIRQTEVNGQPGAMSLAPDGRLMWVMSIDVADGVVQTVRSIINPAKLRHLGPLANVRALFRKRSRRRT
jgi:RNA polymerase sigma-70 factor (ECF subfamily)